VRGRRFTVRAWQQRGSVRAEPASSLDSKQTAEDEERQLDRLAPRLGLCLACEVRVDEDHGVKHAASCQWAAAERRAS
jgi:hypothetical protein